MSIAEAQRVVLRCEDAKENSNLDLSECGLMAVPNCIYLLLSATPPKTCNLAHNQLKKLPVKLFTKFNALLTELRANKNLLTSLPEEVAQLWKLRLLDVSDNKIEHLPPTIYTLTNLEELILDNNELQDVDIDELMKMPLLKTVSLCNNPLQENTRTRLAQCARFTINL